MARHLCLLWLLFLLPDACLEIVSGCCLLCDLIFSCPSFVCQIHVSGGYAVISFWQVLKMWPSFLCCWVYKLSSDVVAECWWKAVLLLLYSLVFMLRCCLLLVAYYICRSARCMCSVSTRGIGCLSGNGLWTGARATLASRIEASCYSNYRGTLETCWARQVLASPEHTA